MKLARHKLKRIDENVDTFIIETMMASDQEFFQEQIKNFRDSKSIHEADPQSTAGSDHNFRTCCLYVRASVRLSPLFKILQNKTKFKRE